MNDGWCAVWGGVDGNQKLGLFQNFRDDASESASEHVASAAHKYRTSNAIQLT